MAYKPKNFGQQRDIFTRSAVPAGTAERVSAIDVINVEMKIKKTLKKQKKPGENKKKRL